MYWSHIALGIAVFSRTAMPSMRSPSAEGRMCLYHGLVSLHTEQSIQHACLQVEDGADRLSELARLLASLGARVSRLRVEVNPVAAT